MRNSSGILFYAIFCLLCYTRGFSQPTLVKDINTSVGSVQQTGDHSTFFFRCGYYLYFRVQDEAGAEVWRTDGTADGTLRVVDLNKGFKDGTTPLDFACLNSFLIFAGDNGESGMELWRTNGQVNIVQRIKDIRPGEGSSVPHHFIEFGGKVYFFIQGTDVNTLELWQTTGTEGGTQFIAEIANASKTTVDVTTTGQNFFYFTCTVANDNSSESQLWRSDGTRDGTIMLKGGSFTINDPTPVSDKLYFVNFDANGYQLWITDGTLPGTAQVKDFGSEAPQDLFAFTNKLIFSANGIWVSDGTETGTLHLATGYLTAGIVYNAMFYGFGADHSSGTNFLLRTNGLAGNTEKIVTLDGLVGDLTLHNEIPVLADKFILPVYTTENGQEIGITDRTQQGTQQIKDIFPGVNSSEPRAWIVFNNKVYFLADDGTHGTELWVSDGTSPGTSLLKDCKPGTENGVSVASPTLEVLNNQIYFLASPSTIENTDLWQSNGTDSGTTLYYDFDTSPFFIGRNNLELYYFSANKVFKSNGQLNGTTVVKDLSSQLGGYQLLPHKPILVGNKLIFYFSTFSGPADFGGEYWVTDGTNSGTKILKDIHSGPSSGIINPAGSNLSNNYIFSADNGSLGQELWITNGTEAGTTLLKDINIGGGSSSPSSFALLNGKVFFSADNGVNGRELWQTDGTSLGTSMVKDIVASTPGSNPKFLTPVGNMILFTAYDATRGWSLWKTNGTSNETTFVKDIYPGTEIERYPTNLTESNGKLFFSMNDGTRGNELWVSDGTDAGTLAIDVAPGAGSSNPSMITTIQGITYFRANGELWRTNGTPQHTEKVATMDPLAITYHDGWIYFTSATASSGVELYKVQFTKFNQTITLQPIPVKVLGDAPFAVVATSTSNLPVSLSAGNSKITVNNNTVTLVSAGSATIKANQAGNIAFAAAEASLTFCINPRKPVITISGGVMAPLLTSSNTEGNRWFLNGALVTEATEKTLTAEETGTYTVQTSVDDCTSVLSDPLAVTVVGIEALDSGITIYPNPATHTIRIEVKGFSGTGTIQLTDMTERVMDMYAVAPGETIVDHNISRYPPAMYLVKVAIGDAVVVKKFMKQ